MPRTHYSLRLKLVGVDDDGKWDWLADMDFKAVTKDADFRDREVELLESGMECLRQELSAARERRTK